MNGINSRDMIPGFIYLLHDDLSDGKDYKIGLTKNIKRRLSSRLSSFKLVHSFPAENMAIAEVKLHNMFANQRLRGEWFCLLAQNVEYIKSITKYENGQFITQNEYLGICLDSH